MSNFRTQIPASVLIIGQNCAKHLQRCLDSLTDFEEIVFIDGGSSDQTEEIARRYPNVKFYFNPWPGFIPQRNLSIDKATRPWCFMIDTDEMLTNELAQEIKKIVCHIQNPEELKTTPVALYRVVRTEYLENEPIESGLGRSDYQERLFIRDRVRYTGGNHHEHLVDGVNSNLAHDKVANLPFHLRVLHDPHYKVEDMITKLPRFALLVGKEKFDRGRRVSAIGIVFSFVWTTFRMSIRSRKMGRRGVVQALMKAYSDSLAKLYIYSLTHFRNHYNESENQSIDKKYLG